MSIKPFTSEMEIASLCDNRKKKEKEKKHRYLTIAHELSDGFESSSISGFPGGPMLKLLVSMSRVVELHRGSSP